MAWTQVIGAGQDGLPAEADERGACAGTGTAEKSPKGLAKEVAIPSPVLEERDVHEAFRNAAPGHREDVDGLRAVSLVMVVIYHINPSLLPGGFIGVDIFFVISGFVVTLSFLTRQCSSTKELLLGFFARRAKRLLPSALIVVSTCSAALAAVAPPEMGAQARKYLRVAVAGLLGNANTWLYYTADAYLDNSEDSTVMNPFLHLWSLGVEEQYYLVFPFLLLLGLGSKAARGAPCSPSSSRLALLFGVSASASLAICAYCGRHSPDAAFYLLPARFWELVAGAALALLSESLQYKSLVTTRRVSILLEVVALSCVPAALVPYNQYVSFPFPGAIVPVLAAMAYISAGTDPNSYINSYLATWLPTYLGRMSYCIYLWHTPILALLHWLALDMRESRTSALLALSPVLMFLLSAATFHLVEEPVRSLKASSVRVLLVSVVSVAITALWVVGMAQLSLRAGRGHFLAACGGLLLTVLLLALCAWIHAGHRRQLWSHAPVLLLLLVVLVVMISRASFADNEESQGEVAAASGDFSSTDFWGLKDKKAQQAQGKACTRTPCMCRKSATFHNPPFALGKDDCPELELPNCLVETELFELRDFPDWEAHYMKCFFAIGNYVHTRLSVNEATAKCLGVGEKRTETALFVIGDSKARNIWPAFARLLPQSRIKKWAWANSDALGGSKYLMANLEKSIRAGDIVYFGTAMCVSTDHDQCPRTGWDPKYNWWDKWYTSTLVQLSNLVAEKKARLLLAPGNVVLANNLGAIPWKNAGCRREKCQSLWERVGLLKMSFVNISQWWRLLCGPKECTRKIPGTSMPAINDRFGHCTVPAALYMSPWLCTELTVLGFTGVSLQ